MSFTGFSANDFAVFHIDGLEERMAAIQERIQPKFKALGEELKPFLEEQTEQPIYIHIARHARRTKNPPNDTWMAFANNARGYKKHPHFQIGLFDDHVFLWLAHIYEMPDKEKVADHFLEQMTEIKRLPQDFMISQDHTKKEAASLHSLDHEGLEAVLERFKNVKRGEFLIGAHLSTDDPILSDGNAFIEKAKDTFIKLAPFYNAALTSIEQ
ncbi:DUF1054 domain-containing protein [Bacillaceae bacterium SIJ1]|uniref:YktB family protein n=1 Tax=Litoribacterium kuwaitense TaxID=1398745 RepID=UPI0013ED3879|nr:DUF1054 domain-containing protein [Litoribacterium kuwaitense]NGP44393.1 DUF1054 domain-containing protein [Litoribacterium kuwaitense]